MDRSEWCALPLNVALGILYDGSEAVKRLATASEAPRKPLPPKFDLKLYRRGGAWNWASEADLESLQYHHRRAAQSAESGGQWAEKDAKKRDQIARWVSWREWEPTVRWSGTRGNDEVQAKAPSSRPDLHSPMPVDERDAIESEGDAL